MYRAVLSVLQGAGSSPLPIVFGVVGLFTGDLFFIDSGHISSSVIYAINISSQVVGFVHASLLMNNVLVQ